MLTRPNFKAEGSGPRLPNFGATDTIPSAARPSTPIHWRLPYSYQRQPITEPLYVVVFTPLTHKPTLSYTDPIPKRVLISERAARKAERVQGWNSRAEGKSVVRKSAFAKTSFHEALHAWCHQGWRNGVPNCLNEAVTEWLARKTAKEYSTAAGSQSYQSVAEVLEQYMAKGGKTVKTKLMGEAADMDLAILDDFVLDETKLLEAFFGGDVAGLKKSMGRLLHPNSHLWHFDEMIKRMQAAYDGNGRQAEKSNS